jgi:hypothetical protein
LLIDKEGKAVVARAQRNARGSPRERWTRNRWAATMVAWFSAQITRGLSDYEQSFERGLEQPYAYRPKKGRS